MNKQQLVDALGAALAKHAAGAREEANEEISRVREAIDAEWMLRTAGVLGNDAILKILRVS